ncbi:MAG TPA: LamG domain-containing protein [Polyangia bacterium]|nr:LamG domain-containing protein [Polyangia bacterium]
MAPLEAVQLDPRSLAAGLVAHWTFDDGSGTSVTDHSSNGHNGILAGGNWLHDGQFGGALRLLYGDTITVNSFPQATPSWTVSFWTRASAAQLQADAAGNDTSTILSTETVFSGGWQVHMDSRPNYHRYDVAYWAGSTVSDYVVVFCNCITPDTWTHLTAVFDNAAKELSLYQGTAEVDRLAMPVPILTGQDTLLMGTWKQGGRSLAGDLDDIAIWDRALTPPEIALISSQPPP